MPKTQQKPGLTPAEAMRRIKKVLGEKAEVDGCGADEMRPALASATIGKSDDPQQRCLWVNARTMREALYVLTVFIEEHGLPGVGND
jgi:hypothetical protein